MSTLASRLLSHPSPAAPPGARAWTDAAFGYLNPQVVVFSARAAR